MIKIVNHISLIPSAFSRPKLWISSAMRCRLSQQTKQSEWWSLIPKINLSTRKQRFDRCEETLTEIQYGRICRWISAFALVCFGKVATMLARLIRHRGTTESFCQVLEHTWATLHLELWIINYEAVTFVFVFKHHSLTYCSRFLWRSFWSV